MIALRGTEAALRPLTLAPWFIMAPCRGWLARSRGCGQAEPSLPCPLLGDTAPAHILEARYTAVWPPLLSQLSTGSGFIGIGSNDYRVRLTIEKKMITCRPVGTARVLPCLLKQSPRSRSVGGDLVLLF